MIKYYITYNKPGNIIGPFQKVFTDINEACKWVKENDIEIIRIETMEFNKVIK